MTHEFMTGSFSLQQDMQSLSYFQEFNHMNVSGSSEQKIRYFDVICQISSDFSRISTMIGHKIALKWDSTRFNWPVNIVIVCC